ncbi:hypothetical protein E2C01_055462 [Portunus trituberculatus]|uniref:Uncharacterized protein n=1 Tax=Portunus trituberculatus TaxID=210409 RepID=A0A5B7GMI1_PORTR|nr:hypothetical protein [Portunus trituberculatus]
MQASYTNDAKTHKHLRKLLSLPYIPENHIENQFSRYYRNAQGCQPLLDYIRNTWIYSNIWPPKSWCVYGRSIRANNDVEGRHHHINLKTRKGQLNFYLLIKHLRDEAKYVTLQVRLLSDGKVLWTQQTQATHPTNQPPASIDGDLSWAFKRAGHS